MFNSGYPTNWSTLKRLAWLFRTVINAVSAVIKTITGNPIHITDALAKPVQALSVSLEPIQDLHGYDNPWPSGGGKNKLPVTLATLQAINTGGTWAGNVYSFRGIDYTVNFNTDGYLTSVKANGTATGAANLVLTATEPHDDFLDLVFNGCPAVGSGSTYVITGYNATDGTSIGVNDTGSGATIPSALSGKSWRLYIAVFNGYTANNLMFYPMIRASGTSDTFEPYSNICPITGHTDADVTRTGKNLFDKAKAVLYANTPRFIKYGVDNYSDTLPNGDCVLDVGTYTLSISGDGTNNPASMAAFDSSGNRLAIAYNNKILSFTTTSAGACYLSINFVDAVTWEDYNIQLELNSTASDYQPYVGTTYPIPLGTTVYGGQLDVLTGVLTVTHKIINLGAYDWTFYTYGSYSGGYNGNAIATDAKPYEASETPNAYCSALKSVSDNNFNQSNNGACLTINVNKTIKVTVPNTTDATTLKAALNGVQLCYELATPQTIQLTPTQVELLLGENNIWSDGTITMTYLADGNASDEEALNILLGGRYVNNHTEDEPSDSEALNILLGEES